LPNANWSKTQNILSNIRNYLRRVLVVQVNINGDKIMLPATENPDVLGSIFFEIKRSWRMRLPALENRLFPVEGVTS
jgi:hypothetical protein